MKMTPAVLVWGAFIVFAASVTLLVFWPVVLTRVEPSDTWRPMTPAEQAGLRQYVRNGCSYCHSLFVRANDWDVGDERLAQAGDYVGQEPAILGTERTGPDLSQEGGEHPDDWHAAHFDNPRRTSPMSVMPSWAFLGPRKIAALTEYVQYQGARAADFRVARQTEWKARAVEAYRRGPDANTEWIHSNVPADWLNLPNPYPATRPARLRGQAMYEAFCVGCHGAVGDGQGPAAPFLQPPPFNFTQLRRHLVRNRYLGGLLYYQIMNGITGTAMPYFKRALESAKIWDVSNYVAVAFVGYSDANIDPRGIDAAYEPPYENPYTPPEVPPPPPAKEGKR